jgi:hypothetical protein
MKLPTGGHRRPNAQGTRPAEQVEGLEQLARTASQWIAVSDVSFEVWSALNLGHTAEIESFQTTYLALAYGRAWKKLRIEPALEGYLNRRFAKVRDPNTLEATLSGSIPAGRPIRQVEPSFSPPCTQRQLMP